MQPKSPQTNGMVERFDGRISDVLRTNRFGSALDLDQTLMRCVPLCNTQLPQTAPGGRTPMTAMRDWHKSHPHLFVKSPRNQAGRDIGLTPADSAAFKGWSFQWKAVPGGKEWPYISAASPVMAGPGMVLAFGCPWYATGPGGFIVENRLPLTGDGIGQTNRLPDALAPGGSGRGRRQHLPRRDGLVQQIGQRQGFDQHQVGPEHLGKDLADAAGGFVRAVVAALIGPA